MNTKPKLLFFAIGGIILILAAAFIWYRLYQDNSKSLKTNTKEIINNSNSSKGANEKNTQASEQTSEERPLPEGTSVSSSKSDEEIEKTTQESDSKFNSNKDEEDTSDGVSVEVEPTDE